MAFPSAKLTTNAAAPISRLCSQTNASLVLSLSNDGLQPRTHFAPAQAVIWSAPPSLIRGDSHLFWFIAFAVAWLITVPPALAQHGVIASSPISAGLGFLIGLAPAIAAAVAVAREGRSGAFWSGTVRLPRPAWTGVAPLLLPPLILGLVYVIGDWTGAPIQIGSADGLALLAGLWLLLAFTEEVGWRS
jgi:hypothetical protein